MLLRCRALAPAAPTPTDPRAIPSCPVCGALDQQLFVAFADGLGIQATDFNPDRLRHALAHIGEQARSRAVESFMAAALRWRACRARAFAQWGPPPPG